MQPTELRRIARTISTVENQTEGYEAILAQAYRLGRWADVIGITGPPGAGKSTLMDALTAHWAEAGERVGILAIDPAAREVLAMRLPISAVCRRVAMLVA